MQQGDISLFQTPDGGDISVDGGLALMSGGLETAAYLSLFGGNEDDTALDGSTTAQWWGNLAEPDALKTYRSQTQNLLQSIPSTSGNRRRLEDAALADLQWLLDASVASSVDVVARMSGINRIAYTITIEANGERSQFKYTENWEGGA